jgi:hypothetical protein
MTEKFLIPQLRNCLNCGSICFPYHIHENGNAYEVLWSCSGDECRRKFLTVESLDSFVTISKEETESYATQAGAQGFVYLQEEGNDPTEKCIVRDAPAPENHSPLLLVSYLNPQ